MLPAKNWSLNEVLAFDLGFFAFCFLFFKMMDRGSTVHPAHKTWEV